MNAEGFADHDPELAKWLYGVVADLSEATLEPVHAQDIANFMVGFIIGREQAAVAAALEPVRALADEFRSRGGDRLLVETGTSVAGMIDCALPPATEPRQRNTPHS